MKTIGVEEDSEDCVLKNGCRENREKEKKFLKMIVGPSLALLVLVAFITLTQLRIRMPHIIGIFAIIIVYSMFKGGLKAGYVSFGITIVYVLYFSIRTYHIPGPGMEPKFYKIQFVNRVLNDIVLLGATLLAGHIIKRFRTSYSELEKKQIQLQRAENFSHVMIIQGSLNGEILKVPSSFCELLGYSEKELLSMGIDYIIHPDDLERAYLKFKRLLCGEYQSYETEERCIKKNGEVIWIYINLFLVKEDDGTPLYYLSYVKDITERKCAEEALKESEERYRLLVEYSTDGIAIYQKGKIVFANKAAAKIVGMKDPQEMIGKNILEYLPFDFHEKTLKRIKRVEEERVIEHFIEEKIIRADHTVINVEKTAIPFIYKGKPAVQGVGRDVTARKRAEENERLLREAREYDELRNEFFANISHELRTPLNVILGTLQLLELYSDNESSKKYVYIMKQNCNRLLRLVNNLIDITKIDTGFFEIKPKNINIINLVEEITLSVADYIENKGITFLFDTDIEEKIIACDPDKIERIVLNLLSNAIKFTDAGGKIQVTVYDGEKNIRISIKDTGIGIPKEACERVFDRFRQVDKTLRRNHEGSGIGLSLVKSLVELHKGKIYLESEYGVGSEFIIELPVRILPEEENLSDEYKELGCIERIHVEFSDIYS
ncbi:sensor histidine kinase [Crassaminicella profunda]|uniref:sensor histidine kinase n=1 Tax=Crassaminicella profunda TaxID=1286698 RepID=UPI001CA796CE|nr:PAS domain-containing sensor histidine kinase [Crassaminicella profunda]QZY54842.1 PAS domain S-box protein [Crassaminicella profunda]